MMKWSKQQQFCVVYNIQVRFGRKMIAPRLLSCYDVEVCLESVQLASITFSFGRISDEMLTWIRPQLFASGGDGNLAWWGVAAGDVGDVTVTHGLFSAAGTGRSHALDNSTSSPQPYDHTNTQSRPSVTLWRPLLPHGYSYKARPGPDPVKFWAPECPDVKNYKWRLNPVWHRMLHSCTHVATVGVKGFKSKFIF